MNSEIKEIKINKANKSVTLINNGIAFSQFGIADEILDYITNLQQELKNYKDLDNSNMETIDCQELEIVNKENIINELQQENERLKELNENASKVCMAEHKYGVDKAEEARDYKTRCEKAVKYIDTNFCIENRRDLKEVVNILQNGSENDE